MPHVHSAEARARRIARAIRKGFVPCRRFQSIACHSYSCIGRSSDTDTDGMDPLISFDPWSRAVFPNKVEQKLNLATGWEDYLPPCPPPDDIAPESKLDHRLISSSPQTCGGGSQDSYPDYVTYLATQEQQSFVWNAGCLDSVFSAAVSLIEAQNDTIANLIRDMKSLRNQMGLSRPSAQMGGELSALETKVKNLAASLPSAVDESVNKRLPGLLDSIQKATDELKSTLQQSQKKYWDFTKGLVFDSGLGLLKQVESVVDASKQSLSASLVEHVKSFLKVYDERIMAKFAALDERFLLQGNGDEMLFRDSMKVIGGIACSFAGGDGDFDAFDASGLVSPARDSMPINSLGKKDADDSAISYTIACAFPCKLDVPQELKPSEFLIVAADVRARLPHIIETPRLPLMICNYPCNDSEDLQSDATSELPSDSEPLVEANSRAFKIEHDFAATGWQA